MFVCGKLHLFFSLEGRDVSGMSSVGQRSAGSSSRLSDSKACKKRKMFFICLTGVFISRFHTTRLHTLLCERQLTLKAEVKVLSAQSKSSIKTISCLRTLYITGKNKTGEEPLSCLQVFQLSCCMRAAEILHLTQTEEVTWMSENVAFIKPNQLLWYFLP